MTTAGLLSLVALGCGGDARKRTYPTQGQVLYEGKPIPAALVVFHPVDSSDKEAPRPRGTVSPDGKYVVGTYDGNDGAPAGEYAVTVEWWQIKSARKEDRDQPPVNKLPPRYANPQTSRLRVQIKEGENALPPIELKR